MRIDYKGKGKTTRFVRVFMDLNNPQNQLKNEAYKSFKTKNHLYGDIFSIHIYICK